MERKSPLDIKTHYPLKRLHTFGMDVYASKFVEITSEKQLPALLNLLAGEYDFFILGGGSNILFTKNFEGLVIKMSTKGVEIIDSDGDNVYVRAMAGESWNDLVAYCVKRGFGGIENLTLIPGNVGSAPIQNIGAYGVELKDVFYMLDAVSIRTGEFREFNRDECMFGYRDSIFKNELKNRYIILSITLRLKRNPELNCSYGAIVQEMEKTGMEPCIEAVSMAVSNIRRSKLPDPEVTGNAGSFFKNPVISQNDFEPLKNKFPNVVSYPQQGGAKIAAGWLIEQAGWKGFRKGDAGVHPMQALVLVNYGNATGLEIVELARNIIDSVNEKFGITLEPEVNIK